MANYLAQHPEVGMAARKESHFLVGDLAPRLVYRPATQPTPGEYLAWFAAVQDKRRLGGASVWYLYSRTAAREIESFNPNAQIIVMLRNPVEMLPLLHSQFVQEEIEPVDDFEAALHLDEKRRRRGTPTAFPPHSYRDAVRFAEQIQRYVDVFGRERVHVVVYEDFRDDALAAFQGTCEFLGVDPTFIPEMGVVNPNSRSRSRTMQRLILKPPDPLRAALHSVTPEGFRRRAGPVLKRLNRQVAARDPLPPQIAASFRPELELEVTARRELLGLDLSRWLSRLAEAEQLERFAD